MVAVQIRDVPEEVRDVLVARARECGQSLQAYLLDLLKREAGFARNRVVLQEWEKYLEDAGVTYDTPVTDQLDAARAEQDEKNTGVPGGERRGGAA